jgi:hypothetical protein
VICLKKRKTWSSARHHDCGFWTRTVLSQTMIVILQSFTSSILDDIEIKSLMELYLFFLIPLNMKNFMTFLYWLKIKITKREQCNCKTETSSNGKFIFSLDDLNNANAYKYLCAFHRDHLHNNFKTVFFPFIQFSHKLNIFYILN